MKNVSERLYDGQVNQRTTYLGHTMLISVVLANKE